MSKQKEPKKAERRTIIEEKGGGNKNKTSRVELSSLCLGDVERVYEG